MSPPVWGASVGWGSLAGWLSGSLALWGTDTLSGSLAGCASESPRTMLYQVLVPKLITAGPASQPTANSAASARTPPAMRAARCRPL